MDRFRIRINGTRSRLAVFLSLSAAGALLVASCATSPMGRRQLLLKSNGDMNQMGIQAFSDLKQKTPIDPDPAVNRYVNCVARAIVAVADDNTGVGSWEVVVFRDATANAFALPGGKIGVHTGLLPVANTPGELAAVLGHEVGHVIARHGNERVSETLVAQQALSVGELLAKDSPYKDKVMAGLGVGAQYGVLLPFSRIQESEADKIGQVLMAKAGFDPHESIQLWKNMSSAGGKKPPEILSTHPSDARRIKDLEDYIPTSYPYYLKAKESGVNPGCTLP